MGACRWIKDPDVPGGRFLVPGCWNRAIHGDHAECHCSRPTKPSLEERIITLERRLKDAETEIERMSRAVQTHK
jgi:hypothetical protein